MASISSVFDDACTLSPQERLELIEAIWDTIPAGADIPLHPDWSSELERRVAAMQSGTDASTSWDAVRDEALARLRHGDAR